MKSINEEDFQTIENYISEELSPEEKLAFDERLLKDKNLRELYSDRITIQSKWNQAEHYQFTQKRVKAILSNAHNKRRKTNTFLYAAASVSVFIGLSFYFLFHRSVDSIESDYALSKTDKTEVTNLSTNKQPSLGSQYGYMEVNVINDTLIIKLDNKHITGKKLILLKDSDHILVKEFDIASVSDSIQISLVGIPTGKYRWTIPGTSYFGEVHITNTP